MERRCEGPSAIGGTPYTPYDVEKSSLVEAWNASGRPYYDYSKYNTGRLDAFAQLDVRVDKVFYFRKCMLGIYVDLQNVTFSSSPSARRADEYRRDRESFGSAFGAAL